MVLKTYCLHLGKMASAEPKPCSELVSEPILEPGSSGFWPHTQSIRPFSFLRKQKTTTYEVYVIRWIKVFERGNSSLRFWLNFVCISVPVFTHSYEKLCHIFMRPYAKYHLGPSDRCHIYDNTIYLIEITYYREGVLQISQVFILQNKE